MKLTEKASLLYGVEYPADSGQRHYDFEIRLATVGDNIDVYESPEIIGGGVSNMRVNTAILATCLLSLGTIPKESITPELLATAMVDSDYDVLQKAQDDLKKKLRRPSPAESAGASGSQSSSLGSTESQKTESVQ
ncbi:hypothetical protein [Paraburkholderia humisilvae]|uniref:Phage tail assembly protein n=1 Tax=Paraburkholderia humisilvae TaxID=627669 RepID=A0A6J5EGD6_9BURK|nr:hypothetical protein [Paraburkholderia humisilvae]CAB3764105.1 hypothetical protein LMG29542_04780 [Paraburkholderia humisilvae]